MNIIQSPQAARWPVLLCIACILLLTHSAWYLGVWPGPMGQDGYSLIANINEGAPKYTGKDSAWLLYALATYGLTNRLEAIVIPSIILHIIIFTRIIGWTYLYGHKKTAIFGLIFIGCAPHIINFETSLYPDSIFSLAFIGALFEIWICLKDGKLNIYSIVTFIILIPVAAFFKGNGILIFVPLFYLASRIERRSRWWLISIAIAWTFVVQIGGKINDLGKGHGALQPLVLFETVNFMQSKPMNLWETQHMVTDKTKQIIYRYISQKDIDGLFDRDYWDTLWHQNQDRVKFRHMTKEDNKALRKEFFTYNLWRNIPAFISSRINIFLASALAQGGMVGPGDAQHGLDKVQTRSQYNVFKFELLPNVTKYLFEHSYGLRFLLWSPILGIFLIIYCPALAIQQRNLNDIFITLTLAAEMAGIFIFSIAAEYRYMLIIFYSPLLLLPLLYQQKRRKRNFVPQ